MAVATVRKATRSELKSVRDMRLQALSDEPTRFGTAYAAEPSLAQWLASCELHDWLGAWVDGRLVGIGAMFFDDTSPDGAPQLGAMWVDPPYRRLGVGQRLERAAASEAAERGFDAVGLWVVDGNDAAAHSYQSYGYSATGAWKPAPRDPCLKMWRMRRWL